jgi:hypothetical protein
MALRRLWTAGLVLALAACGTASEITVSAIESTSAPSRPAATVAPTDLATTTTLAPTTLAPTTLATTTLAPTTLAPRPGPTDAALAASLALTGTDVPGLTFRLADAGNLVDGTVTLDVCNAAFPSDALRTGRYQQVISKDGNGIASDENVVYRTVADATQAMAEVRRAATNCPADFVPSPLSGGLPTRFTIKAIPLASVPGAVADTVALDVALLDQSGRQATLVTVYQRRGRVLVGVYARDLDTARPIVAASAKKLAALARADAGD